MLIFIRKIAKYASGTKYFDFVLYVCPSMYTNMQAKSWWKNIDRDTTECVCVCVCFLWNIFPLINLLHNDKHYI